MRRLGHLGVHLLDLGDGGGLNNNINNFSVSLLLISVIQDMVESDVTQGTQFIWQTKQIQLKRKKCKVVFSVITMNLSIHLNIVQEVGLRFKL